MSSPQAPTPENLTEQFKTLVTTSDHHETPAAAPKPEDIPIATNIDSEVTSDQIEAVKAQFKKFDLNNDGKLSRKEYYIMLQKDKKHLNQTHIYCFFFALEPSPEGFIQFNDLVSLMEEVKKGNPGLLKTALCKNILLHYDKNHDGHISLKEFKRIARDFELADENHVKELFDKIDANHDNKISSEELVNSLNELFSLVEKLNDKIESTVTDEQIELIKALFKKLDKNNDNKLSREEFFSMLKEDRVMLRKKHIKCFFFAVLPDKDGLIDFTDLMNLMNDVKAGKSEVFKAALCKNLFSHYDKNKDGSLSFSEFKRLAHEFGLTEEVKARKLFEQIDTNANNSISSEELVHSLNTMFRF